MAVGLQFTDVIVNVHWQTAGLQFLYSGADGMFGSEDGEPSSETGTAWTRAPSSVAATSLAWVDDVWVAVGPEGCWRSEDGAKTWDSVAAPTLYQVVAMKPESNTDDESAKGIFAGWSEDDEGDNHIVYTSHDLGKTWAPALTISTTVGDTGFESIQALSGCGKMLFVCTTWHSEIFHAGDGKIYSSSDGQSFTSQTVFGNGSVIRPEDPDQFPRKAFSARAVSYDAMNETYIAVGGKEIIPELGVQESYLIFATSSSGSFALSEGSVAESARQTDQGTFISPAESAAGGGGKHVTGLYLFRNGPGGAFVTGELKAIFLVPGISEVLLAMGATAGGYVGSFCFKASGEGSTDTAGESEEGLGVFACVAFGAEGTGGVFVSSSEEPGFSQTHHGTGIDDGGPRGAVGVGRISFLSETS